MNQVYQCRIIQIGNQTCLNIKGYSEETFFLTLVCKGLSFSVLEDIILTKFKIALNASDISFEFTIEHFFTVCIYRILFAYIIGLYGEITDFGSKTGSCVILK